MTLNCHNRRTGIPRRQSLHPLKRERIGCGRVERLRCGEVMIAAKKSSGKFNTEMFSDVPVLQRKWQAALRPGESLPRYEDVMLGSLGKLADHTALIKENHQTLQISRNG